MIYHFPDLDSLRLAIASADVPPEISLAPAIGGVDEEGHVWLQPSVALPAKAKTALRKRGIEAIKGNGDLQAEEIHCWLQLLPAVREKAVLVPSPQTPVLFELPGGEQLSDLVGEMLRLGNDRQSFRWLTDEEDGRVLLRVVGPPYYSLLRALEPDDSAKAPRAYVEKAPRVWMEFGYTHSLVGALKPAAGKVLLIRPPREWTFVPDAPFRDIYEILEFALPERKVSWQETETKSRLTVPLRLAASGSPGQAELWVLHERPLEQLDALVRDSEDSLIRQLAFAVVENEGHKIVVVRARPSKQGPPVLVLDGAGYRPFWKLPNLFVPCGRGLHPPLRRDAVRKLLAEDPEQVTWLSPKGDNRFTPQSVPETAFRPLADWVDYVLDRERQALQVWAGASTFEFELFVCKEDSSNRPPKPQRDKEGKRPARDQGEDVEIEPVVPQLKVVKKSGRREPADSFVSLPKEKPSELQQRLREKETQFLEAEGPLDTPERQTLWPEMAALHTALNQSADAAVCWANSLWQTDDLPPVWARTWADGETLRPVIAADFDRLLGLKEPTVADVRALTACVLNAAAESGTAQKALVERLSRVREFLEKHENQLGIRSVWLAWVSLAKLSAGDVLGLARVRDRLLERLLTRGLNPEYDLPSFLRFAGQHSSDRMRSVRDRITRLCEAAHQWINQCYAQSPEHREVAKDTKAYADMTFAFGLARLGEASECRRLRAKAVEVLEQGKDKVHLFLLQAYDYRIEQVLAGKPHVGPLPDNYLEYLQADIGNDKLDRLQLYKVDRLRKHSRILEPQEKIDPYRKWYRADELTGELIELTDSTDRQHIEQQMRRLFQTVNKAKPYLQVLATALAVAPRVSEAFTVDVLNRLNAAHDSLPPPQDLRELMDRAELLERALFLAAHYDRAEHVQALVARFLNLLESQRGQAAVQALEGLAGQCFRGLRKVGLRDESDRLLHQMASLVLQGRDLPALRKKLGNQWPTAVRALLQIAGGWFYFGKNESAKPVLEEAETLLFETELLPVDRTRLACAYATTLGQAPVEPALKRLVELFRKLDRVSDTFTTNTHYSLSQLQVIEAVVLAVVSDDFNLGQNARRWLDEDEYLVRKRIHRDLRALMAKAGV